MNFLSRIGAEHEVHGAIQHPDDFGAQCRYAYARLKKALERNGASLADVVKQTTHVTDVRFQGQAGERRSEAYSGLPLPAHTFLTVCQLAWPHMLVEIDVIAVASLPAD